MPPQIDKNVEREILNHRMLNHPNVVRFLEVGSMSILTTAGLVSVFGQQPRTHTPSTVQAALPEAGGLCVQHTQLLRLCCPAAAWQCMQLLMQLPILTIARWSFRSCS
jgi:hypothetical protein